MTINEWHLIAKHRQLDANNVIIVFLNFWWLSSGNGKSIFIIRNNWNKDNGRNFIHIYPASIKMNTKVYLVRELRKARWLGLADVFISWKVFKAGEWRKEKERRKREQKSKVHPLSHPQLPRSWESFLPFTFLSLSLLRKVGYTETK